MVSGSALVVVVVAVLRRLLLRFRRSCSLAAAVPQGQQRCCRSRAGAPCAQKRNKAACTHGGAKRGKSVEKREGKERGKTHGPLSPQSIERPASFRSIGASFLAAPRILKPSSLDAG